jgi:hypothetical protein
VWLIDHNAREFDIVLLLKKVADSGRFELQGLSPKSFNPFTPEGPLFHRQGIQQPCNRSSIPLKINYKDGQNRWYATEFELERDALNTRAWDATPREDKVR